MPLSNASSASLRSALAWLGVRMVATPFLYDSFIHHSMPVYPGALRSLLDEILLLELRVISTGANRTKALGSLAVALLLSLVLIVKQFGQPVVLLLGFLVSHERWREKLLLVALQVLIPSMVVLCWTVRNIILVGARCTLSRGQNSLLHNAARGVAYRTGMGFEKAQEEVWRRLEVPS